MVLLYKNLFIKFRSDMLSRSAFIVNSIKKKKIYKALNHNSYLIVLLIPNSKHNIITVNIYIYIYIRGGHRLIFLI